MSYIEIKNEYNRDSTINVKYIIAVHETKKGNAEISMLNRTSVYTYEPYKTVIEKIKHQLMVNTK